MRAAAAGQAAPSRRLVACALLLAGAGLAEAGLCRAAVAAADETPVGEWRTLDDRTQQPQAIVRIGARNGLLYGVVEKVLISMPRHQTCADCTDDRRGKPIIGLEIIRGLRRDGDQWDGGTILDPDSGQVYKCRMRMLDHGQKLSVRGFLGIPLLGRTQVWERIR